jgi:hypothetical protein
MVDDQALKFRAQNATTSFLNAMEKRKVANGASLLTFLKRGRSRVPPVRSSRWEPVRVRAVRSDAGCPLAPASPLTFCSGAALVPGAHCSHRRTVSWQLSVMRTPVALPPILERMEQRMPEHRRFTQTISLEGCLPEEAKRLRKQAQGTLRALSASALFAEPAS